MATAQAERRKYWKEAEVLHKTALRRRKGWVSKSAVLGTRASRDLPLRMLGSPALWLSGSVPFHGVLAMNMFSPRPCSPTVPSLTSCYPALSASHSPPPKSLRVGDSPGGPVVKIPPSNARGSGSIPGGISKIPHALGPENQNMKQKQYCNKFNKDFKNGQKNLKKKIIIVVQLTAEARHL